MPDYSKEFRFRCECIHHLRYTGGNPALVKDLIARITKIGGAAAAEHLREGMRAEWLRQKESRK